MADRVSDGQTAGRPSGFQEGEGPYSITTKTGCVFSLFGRNLKIFQFPDDRPGEFILRLYPATLFIYLFFF